MSYIRKPFVIGSIIVFMSAAFLIVFKVHTLLSDPSIALLVTEGKAGWIRFEEPADMIKKDPGTVTVNFRRKFDMKKVPDKALLTVRAMKSAIVYLDGRAAYADNNMTSWKEPRKVDLTPWLTPGPHELIISVSNINGPAVMLAYCGSLDLFSGEDWEAAKEEGVWKPASSVDRYRPSPLSRMFPRADKALLSQAQFLLPLFLAVFFWALAWHTPGWRTPLLERLTPSVRTLKWVLIISWAVLAVNNFKKLSPYLGFDIKGHWEYIQYVAFNKRIPLATEGWQMFQSPLYYMVSAPLYLFFKNFFEIETVARILRIIPILSGMAQVELSYLALRYVCPKRKDLQALGLLIGGLLPMNLYMSQELGNEPMAGMLSAAVLVVALGIFHKTSEQFPLGRLMTLGVLLGLAMLTKVTAILLIPALVVFLAGTLIKRGQSLPRLLSAVAIPLGIAFIIAGWYYLRNWMELGRPFIGGWDASRGIVWWQEPGYRTIRQLYIFGEFFIYPVKAAFIGFPDSIYSSFWMDGFLSSFDFQGRPPWNYNLMLSGAWLAVLPGVGILAGILIALPRPSRPLRHGELFAVCVVAIYFAAVLDLYLKVPIYSTAKASYTIGLTPLYAVLGATGLGIFMRGPILRAFIFGAVACWAFAAYFTYFII